MITENILTLSISKVSTLLSDKLIPWSFLAQQLVNLFKRYSTGLSVHIATDEILAAWNRKSSFNKQTQLLFRIATIVEITQDPEVWILRLSDEKHIALFAHSSVIGRFQPNNRIVISQPEFISSALTVEALKIVKDAFHDQRTFDQSSKNKVRNKKKLSTSANSLGDVTNNIKHLKPQCADTPSQQQSIDLYEVLKEIVLPSKHIWYDLNTIDESSLYLQYPMNAYTLQHIWNQRSLQPKWIYAIVVQVVSTPTPFIRLQDPCEDPSSQPSVVWTLDKTDKITINLLKPGDAVLLMDMVVTPTGDSFKISSTPKTVQYYKPSGIVDDIPFIAEDESENNEDIQSRPIKRPRTENNPMKSMSAVTTETLDNIKEPFCSSGHCVAVARITKDPVFEADNSVSFESKGNVLIQMKGHDFVRILQPARAGDELLLYGLRKDELDNNVPKDMKKWTATGVENITTMEGVLHAPFAYNTSTVPLHEQTDDKNEMHFTKHVLVSIKDVSLNMIKKNIMLTIKNVNEDASSPKLKVSVDLCYIELFGMTKSAFWNENVKTTLESKLPRLKKETWMMTLTYTNNIEATPLLRACVVRPT